MTEVFHLFLELPFELRRMIWKECLPKSRVFDTMLPCLVYEKSRCRGTRWSSRQSWRPPIITRVCRESRAVAHETGRVLFYGDDPNVPDYIDSVWSDATTDIVAQYWCPGLESVMFWPHDEPDTYLFHYAPRYRGTLIAEARLSRALRSPTPSADWSTLSQLQHCYVCLENPVMIHLTRKELLLSGLFGRLGEEFIQLVDPTDVSRLKKFHNLALTSSQQLPETLEFFEQLHTSTSQYKIHNWARETLIRWIYQEWLQAKQTSFVGIPHPERIWLGPRSPGVDEKPFNPMAPETYSKYSMWFHLSDTMHFLYDEKHPWVKEKLAKAPRFLPRIMIRPCIKRCWFPPRRLGVGGREDIIA
ncbi:hypothetical protein N7539_004243 [Penicillium diatomitis]|uniref:2EXR domain-containing protein n=1 Tax=Penicillium diatomitis TaxID=2819901 RepID=A0A9W9XEE0_9EURO|nr:uncharacterized protein N7539_004243 [Penicillium diatomitis]KAJ5489353.1 hypothetical protein N7539_004243 [Penicillium diatomitis]